MGKTVHDRKLQEGPEIVVCSLSLKFGKQCFRAQGNEENTPCTVKLYNIKLKILPTVPTRSTIARTATTKWNDFSSQLVRP